MTNETPVPTIEALEALRAESDRSELGRVPEPRSPDEWAALFARLTARLYELDGDRPRVACVVGPWKGKEWAGKARPEGFDPQAADAVIELERAE
jgi:hypothetical protein